MRKLLLSLMRNISTTVNLILMGSANLNLSRDEILALLVISFILMLPISLLNFQNLTCIYAQ